MAKVAVIGAGGSGLVSVKTCLEDKMEPICFEKTGHIGGVWHFSDEPRPDPSGPATGYKELFMNTSKEMSAFSDFPFPEDLPPYVKGQDMYNYYKTYAEHFGLMKYINLNTEVLAIEAVEENPPKGRWQVTIREASGQEKTDIFDAVMVCTGLHTAGYVPPYPGLEDFEGEVLHSCQVRKGSDFAGKTVLIVGSAVSAGDMAVICGNHARQVYISLREGAWVVPRWMSGKPTDTIMNFRWKNDWIPSRIFCHTLQSEVTARYDPTNHGFVSRRSLMSVHVIMNDDFPTKVMNGTVKVKSQVESFGEGSKVTFKDGSSLSDIDVVIFGTGYELKFPFLKKDIVEDGYDNCKLYLQIFPPKLRHPTIAFVGLDAPLIAGQNSSSEMQARYVTKVFKGEVKLPPVQEMESEVNLTKSALYKQFGGYYPISNPAAYKDFLAKQIGALPSLARLAITDPRLAYHYYFGPAYPPCYRLVGLGAKPGAREAFLQCGDRQFHGVTASTVRRDAWKEQMKLKKASWFYYAPFGMFVALLACLFSYIGIF